MGRKVDTRMDLRFGRKTRSDQEESTLEVRKTTIRTSSMGPRPRHEAQGEGRLVSRGIAGQNLVTEAETPSPRNGHMGNLGRNTEWRDSEESGAAT